MKVEDMMTPEQAAKICQPKAWDNLNRQMGHQLGATAFQMTGHFHMAMGLGTPEAPIMPSVTMRERRLRLILEEFLELVEACGFEVIDLEDPAILNGNLPPWRGKLGLRHIEGSRYNLVETADALGDLNVVVAGTGVEFGIPMHFVDYEIYTSNLSKLDENGKPIVNHCKACGPDPENVYLSTCDCDDESQWLKPGAPLGKILKPEGFVPTNIPAVLYAYQEKEI